MCIPCVMCGACMDPDESVDLTRYETACPDCGHPVSEANISCPECFTFLPLNARRRKIARENELRDLQTF